VKHFPLALAAGILAAALGAPAYSSEDAPPPASAAPDLSGAHDFDFWIGEWRVQHRRLKERLAGNHDWIAFDGTATTRAALGGMANVDDSLFNLPGHPYRGVGVAAYDAKTGQWSTWGLDGRDPFAELDPPARGRFDHGVGTFYADDTFEGKPIRVRFIWTHATPKTAHFEQAFSPDDGKTWETNWISDFQRVEPAAASASIAAAHAAAEVAAPAPAGDLSGLHAFDDRMGEWRVHHRRLKERLAGSHEWVEFDGRQSGYKTMDGWGNAIENDFDMPGGAYSGLTIRAYDARTGLWAIWWLDGRDPSGALDPPMKGRFDKGVGTFYADDTFKGKPIRVRFTWTQVTARSGHWEQAYSPDAGKTWETNWISDFQRVE
jgi:hypothetical protein